MRKIVLDTNCLLQTLPSKSPYHSVWQGVLSGEISLCVNTEILEEYEEILATKTTPDIARNVVEAIVHLPSTIFQDVYMHFHLIESDVDDNKFVDCAIASDAEYIVTNDRHFTELERISWPKVSVITLENYVKSFSHTK